MFADTTKLFYNTEPIDKKKAAAAVKELYQACNTATWEKNDSKARPVRDPIIWFVDGPTHLAEDLDVNATVFNPENYNHIAHFVTKRGYGTRERVHASILQVFHDAIDCLNLEKPGWHNPIFEPVDYLIQDEESKQNYYNHMEQLYENVWNETYLCITFLDKCYVVNRPLTIKTNDRGLHCSDGPAMTFRDGSEVYAHEGIRVKKQHLLYPKSIPLEFVHAISSSRKHFIIDLMGVENYLEQVKEWKPPETKNRFKKFFGFHKMIVPGDDEIKDSWKKKGQAHRHIDKPSIVRFFHGTVNGRYGLTMSNDWADDPKFNTTWHHFTKSPFKSKHGKDLFNSWDKELWELFNVNEMMSRGVTRFEIGYQNGKFWLKSDRQHNGVFPPASNDIAPSWFKAKMFRNENAVYENKKLNYAVKLEDGKLYYAGNILVKGDGIYSKEDADSPMLHCRNSLFGGCENLPSYQFDVNIESDSWEGLLEKWAWLAFEWLGMHENSRCSP